MIRRRDPFDEFAFLIRKESATALGLAGKNLQKALDALAAYDANREIQTQQKRTDVLKAASDALHGYMVQKELNGIADNATLKRAYKIPAEVWRQLGFTHEHDAE